MNHNKLVRDLIPNYLKDKDIDFKIKRLNENDFIKELFLKLKEECNEVCDSKEKEGLIEELADLQEVVNAICDNFEIKPEDIEKIRKKKLKEKGGFENKIYLISTS